MTTTNITADDLTRKQIRELRAEARAHDDLVTVDMCDIALDEGDSDGTGTALGGPCTVAEARANLAQVINDARAAAGPTRIVGS